MSGKGARVNKTKEAKKEIVRENNNIADERNLPGSFDTTIHLLDDKFFDVVMVKVQLFSTSPFCLRSSRLPMVETVGLEAQTGSN